MHDTAPSRDAIEATPLIVGLGEALIDRLPDGDVVGGAPLNVSVHAAQLGNRAAMISRIGRDERGELIVHTLRSRGVDTDGVQRDALRPTGTVDVVFGADGEPGYTINENAAWDAIGCDAGVREFASSADAICFGTLAQRSRASRDSIHEIVAAARSAVVLFDVNLRQDYFDRELVEASLHASDAAKCNADELAVMATMFGLNGSDDNVIGALADRFDLRWVAVTRGARGTMVAADGQRHEADPVSTDTSAGDAVGAGDSVSAALLHGAVRGWSWDRTVDLANRIGAFVASQRGPCPRLPESLVERASGAPAHGGGA